MWERPEWDSNPVLWDFRAELYQLSYQANWELEVVWVDDKLVDDGYLTIIPRARMGFESIAHEAEGRVGYWLRGHEGERNNCFSKIQLVRQKKYRDKTSFAS